MTQMAHHFPSKPKALSSIPSMARKESKFWKKTRAKISNATGFEFNNFY
jgi:hypothetical protein